jgi:hypothetical protein
MRRGSFGLVYERLPVGQVVIEGVEQVGGDGVRDEGDAGGVFVGGLLDGLTADSTEGVLTVDDREQPLRCRAAEFMDVYADRPMDLADATLVALAEEQSHRKVFSLDSAFHFYRIGRRQRFDVVPPALNQHDV